MNCYLQNNQQRYTLSDAGCIITTPSSIFEQRAAEKVIHIADGYNRVRKNNYNFNKNIWATTNLSANTETYMTYVNNIDLCINTTIMFTAVFTKSNYSGITNGITSNDSVTFTFKSGDTVDTLTYKLYPQYMNSYQIMHRMHNINQNVYIYVTSTVDITLFNDGNMMVYYICY